MLHAAAALLAIALLAPVFGLASGLPGWLQLGAVVALGAGLGSLLPRIAGR